MEVEKISKYWAPGRPGGRSAESGRLEALSPGHGRGQWAPVHGSVKSHSVFFLSMGRVPGTEGKEQNSSKYLEPGLVQGLSPCPLRASQVHGGRANF